jgi:hypothetical protein
MGLGLRVARHGEGAMNRAKQCKRRTVRVNRGLIAMASIVENLRMSIGEVDDPDEEADIVAALRWIHGQAGQAR